MAAGGRPGARTLRLLRLKEEILSSALILPHTPHKSRMRSHFSIEWLSQSSQSFGQTAAGQKYWRDIPPAGEHRLERSMGPGEISQKSLRNTAEAGFSSAEEEEETSGYESEGAQTERGPHRVHRNPSKHGVSFGALNEEVRFFSAGTPSLHAGASKEWSHSHLSSGLSLSSGTPCLLPWALEDSRLTSHADTVSPGIHPLSPVTPSEPVRSLSPSVSLKAPSTRTSSPSPEIPDEGSLSLSPVVHTHSSSPKVHSPSPGAQVDKDCSFSPRSTASPSGTQLEPPGSGRRPRTAFTAPQIRSLERVFQRSPYLGAQDKAELCRSLELSDKQIRNWFQNRRMKLKRSLQDGMTQACQLKAAATNHFMPFTELHAFRSAPYPAGFYPALPENHGSFGSGIHFGSVDPFGSATHPPYPSQYYSSL
ncbi:hypothetical protein DNTS_009039 [Danionella cerebrum]|uniref:Homeobox domain-containing protein n=1 Tax=Danionella cerebrum TaxID=2873325 RepID=A0A553MQ69_9TELE|nr:hypothetical protein DNTS_009039 [Danionella translucida]